MSMRERKRLTVSGFLGLDATSSPAAADPRRATEATNFCAEGGVLRKRHGWRQILPRLPARIDGVFGVPHATGRTLLAYAGAAFYLLVGGAWERVPLRNTVGGLTESLVARRILGFPHGGFLYLVGAGLYLRYGCFDGAWEIRTVDPHIPTTTVGIAPVGEGDGVREEHEPVNLLTPRRKNTLFGGAQGAEWVLDGAVALADPLEMRVPFVQDGVVRERVLVNRPAEGGRQLFDEEGVLSGSLDPARGRITLAIDSSDAADSPAITVTFTVAVGAFGDVSDRGRQLIYSARFGTLFGVGGTTDRLFLSGVEAHSNLLFFSERDDPTYFPDRYTVTVGSDGGAVTAMLRLFDGTLAVFKEGGESTEPTVYGLVGEYRYFYDENGALLRSVPVFSVGAGAVGECAVSQWAVADLAGEGVFLSEAGVCGVELSEQLTVDVRRVSERDYGLRGLLSTRGTADAVLCSHAGRLYLALGEECFVTDARTLHTDRTLGTRGYEWWRLAPFPARLFFVWEGALCFATADGRICRAESEGWEDATFDVSAAGELGFDYPTGRVVYGASISHLIANGRRIRFHTEGLFTSLVTGAERIEGTRILLGEAQADALLSVGDGEVFVAGAGKTLSEGVAYYIVSPDAVTGTLSLARTRGGTPIDLTGVSTGLRLYRHLGTRTLWIRDADAGTRSFALSLSPDGEALRVAEYLLPADGTEPLDPVATVEDARPVTATWETPPLTLDAPTAPKTLLSLSVLGRGCFFLGARSASGAGECEVHLESGASLSSFDPAHLTLTDGEAESATVRAPIRTFSAVRLCVHSARAEACEIRALSLTARIKRERKGVR